MNRVRLYIETWSQFVNKKHFKIRQSNLVVHFFKIEKTMGFFFCGVLIDALVQVPARKTNITCIAQVTFKMIHKGLLVNDWWLDFT